jgi:hypothetical protein
MTPAKRRRRRGQVFGRKRPDGRNAEKEPARSERRILMHGPWWKPPHTIRLWMVFLLTLAWTMEFGILFGFEVGLIFGFFLAGKHKDITVVWPWQTKTTNSRSASTAS